MYTADGYMSAQIMDPDRQQSDPNFHSKPPKLRPFRIRIGPAYGTYVAYCGTYTVEGIK